MFVAEFGVVISTWSGGVREHRVTWYVLKVRCVKTRVPTARAMYCRLLHASGKKYSHCTVPERSRSAQGKLTVRAAHSALTLYDLTALQRCSFHFEHGSET